MNICGIDPAFTNQLFNEGAGILSIESNAPIEGFYPSEELFGGVVDLGPLPVVDCFLENMTLISRDQLRRFIDLFDRYNEAKNARESEMESASESDSSRTESLPEPMVVDSSAASAVSKSRSSKSSVIAEIPESSIEKSCEVLYFEVYNIATLKFKEWHEQRKKMHKDLGLDPWDYYESDLTEKQRLLDTSMENVKNQAILTEIKKHVKYFTAKEFTHALDLKKFLETVQKRERKDKEVMSETSEILSKLLLIQKKYFVISKLNEAVEDLIEFNDVVKATKYLQNKINELPTTEANMTDYRELMIRLHEFMLKTMDLNLSYIKTTLEEKFKDAYYKLYKFDAEKDDVVNYLYDEATETMIFAKCTKLSIALEKSRDMTALLVKGACDCFLTDEDRENLSKTALEVVDVLKRPQVKPDYVEISQVAMNKNVYVKVQRRERRRIRGHPNVEATSSVDTLAGTDEIGDE